METVPQSRFATAYESTPPWVIGRPQPAVVALEKAGLIRGAVLDIGCGAGEHTIYLAERGYEVLGADAVLPALELAGANAAAGGVDARFEQLDALRLEGPPRFDTVIDSALFHVFGADDQRGYAEGLRAVCRENAVVHVLALADTETGFGPRVSDSAIRTAFAVGWDVLELKKSEYHGIAGEAAAEQLGVAPGPVVSAAWLASMRRR